MANPAGSRWRGTGRPDFVSSRRVKIWVHTEGGGQRPAVHVGDGENATFFGGPPLAYVVMEDTEEGGEVGWTTLPPASKANWASPKPDTGKPPGCAGNRIGLPCPSPSSQKIRLMLRRTGAQQ